MKVLFFNGSDIEGGASRAATRLLHGVHAQGADARLYVQRKYGDDPLICGPRSLIGKAFGFARPTIEQHMFGIRPGKVNGPFSASFLPDGLAAQAAGMTPDIIHLHWVARMMRLETLQSFNAPLVWTLHDSWAFTGGCYLPGDCTRYRESCGACPVLGSAGGRDDLSSRIWQRKQIAWQSVNMTIVAPSRWMAASARASSLFRNTRIEVIPNGLEVDRFKPVDQGSARDILSLPQDRKLLLFGAKGAIEDRNKGFHLLGQALRELSDCERNDSIELLVFGSSEPKTPPDMGFKTHYLGWQHDDATLALLYAAADVFVLPSLQESLGYTAMEAMACGTPCVAFNQGGVPDLIDHELNGYLADPYEPVDLARGIAWVLENADLRKRLAIQARQKVEQEFDVEKVAARHMALYRELLMP